MKAGVGALLPGLGVCVPQEPAPAPQIVGEPSSGQPVYQFRVTSSNALGLTRVSEGRILARAQGICPGGHVELARRTQASRRISGVFYFDVDVRIACR
tara:strand:+ start:4164 stop:4457 length:294 start_codon:yes stop_codon:yes gene_type:complete